MASFIRQPSFSGGEIGPAWWGRTDIDRYPVAARTIKNWLVTKSGSLINRPGTRHVGAALSSSATNKSWLEQFYFSGDQTYILEFGHRELRVWNAQAAQVSLGIPTPILATNGTTTIQKSLDNGRTWFDAAALPGSPSVVAIARNSSRWCVVGVNYCATSDDEGVSWTSRTLGTISARAICWNGTRFIVVGDGGAFTSSTDGATWAVVGTMATAVDWKIVVAGTSEVVARGHVVAGSNYNEYTARSTDNGVSWTVVDMVYTTTTSGGSPLAAQSATNLVWTGSRWVLVRSSLIYWAPGSYWQWTIAVYASNDASSRPSWSAVKLFTDTIYNSSGGTAPTTAPIATEQTYSSSGYISIAFGNDTSQEYTYPATIVSGDVQYLASNGRVLRYLAIGGNLFYIQRNTLKLYQRVQTDWLETAVLLVGLTTAAQSLATTQTIITSPYASVDLPRLRMVQSGDTIYIFRRGYAVYKLVRSLVSGSPAFTFSQAAPVPPTPTLAAPTRSGAKPTANDTHPDVEWSWVISWVDKDGLESLPGAVFTETASQCYPDRPCILTWTGLATAVEYYIFRGRGGEYGYVGSKKATAGTGTETFTDAGDVPNLSVVPRTYEDVLVTDAPAVGAYYQDRLMAANSAWKPNTVRGSKTSDYLNFDKMKYQIWDSPIEFAANSRRYEEVRALVPLRELLVLTSESEGSLSGSGGNALTFETVDFKVHSKRGCSWVEPTVIGNTCIYVQREGQVVRDIVANANATITDSFTTNELTMFVDHLLAGSGRTIVDMAYCQHPHSILWFVLSDGKVISLSYLPELKQLAWMQHDFGGVVESVCSIYDGTEDIPWFTVYRYGTTRTVERLATRVVNTLASGCFLDAAESFTGGAATVTTNFPSGTVVGCVRDGVYVGTQTVSLTNTVTVTAGYSMLWVGLIITADFESLDLAEAYERKKVVSRAYLRITDTPAVATSAGALQAGEDLSHLNSATLASTDEGTIEILVDSTYNPGGRVAVRLATPTPIEILSISREVTAGL